MKKLSLLIAAVLGLGVLAPVTAEAGCRTRVTVEACGTRVYWELRFVGYNCDGCPLYRWVVTHRVPPCRHEEEEYSGGYNHGGYSHGGYSGGGRNYYPRRPRCGTGFSLHIGR